MSYYNYTLDTSIYSISMMHPLGGEHSIKADITLCSYDV